MRDYTTVRPRLIRNPDLAECGLVAGVLYANAMMRCDNYGRLAGDVPSLVTEVLPHYARAGTITEDQVREARQQLVARGLWHLYTVHGREYVEILGWDDAQTPSWLARRGANADWPDDPNRPDLWVARRTKYEGRGKRKQTEDAQPPGEQPQTTTAGVPSQAEGQGAVPSEVEGKAPVQGAVPAGGEVELPVQGAVPAGGETKAVPSRPAKWLSWYEQRFAVLPPANYRADIDALQQRGVTDELIIAALEKALADKARVPIAVAKGILANLVVYGITTVAGWQEFEAAKAQQPQAIGTADRPPEPPPDDDDDPIARRVREQTARLAQVSSHAG